MALANLQDEKVRHARTAIFQLKGKPLESWSKEETEAAGIVCQTYDTIGIMVRHQLLPKQIIVDSWGPSLRNSWPILSPLIRKYRQEFGAIEYLDDYEWLANEANEAESRRQSYKKPRKAFDVTNSVRTIKAQAVNTRLLTRLRNLIMRRSTK